MIASAKFADTAIDRVKIDVHLTMTVEEARALMRQQPEAWPASDFGRVLATILGRMVGRIEHEHSSEGKDV